MSRWNRRLGRARPRASRADALSLPSLRRAFLLTLFVVGYVPGYAPSAASAQKPPVQKPPVTYRLRVLEGATVEDAVVTYPAHNHFPVFLYRKSGDWRELASRFAREVKPTMTLKYDNNWEMLKRYGNMSMITTIGAGKRERQRFETLEWSEKPTGVVKISVLWMSEPPKAKK